jgi:hypothetical protein
MKAEISVTLAGQVSLEVIAETEFERGILEMAWRQRGYVQGNGKTTVGHMRGSTGFYVPLFETKPPSLPPTKET